jgi:hypothetical protein
VPEQTTQRITIDASPQRVCDVIVDVARYPEWAGDVKQVDIQQAEDSGRPGLVAFRAAAMGRSVSYVLRYYYGTSPLRVAWRLVEGDVVSRMDGEYLLEPTYGNVNSTEVTYHLSVDMRMPIPGFMRRRGEARIVRAALQGLKSRAESPVAG